MMHSKEWLEVRNRLHEIRSKLVIESQKLSFYWNDKSRMTAEQGLVVIVKNASEYIKTKPEILNLVGGIRLEDFQEPGDFDSLLAKLINKIEQKIWSFPMWCSQLAKNLGKRTHSGIGHPKVISSMLRKTISQYP